MINPKFSCLLTHQHPPSTTPVSLKVCIYTKFRMLTDYFHLALLRKAWSLWEPAPSLSEQLISFKMQSSEVRTQKGKGKTSEKSVLIQIEVLKHNLLLLEFTTSYHRSTEADTCPAVRNTIKPDFTWHISSEYTFL